LISLDGDELEILEGALGAAQDVAGVLSKERCPDDQKSVI